MTRQIGPCMVRKTNVKTSIQYLICKSQALLIVEPRAKIQDLRVQRSDFHVRRLSIWLACWLANMPLPVYCMYVCMYLRVCMYVCVIVFFISQSSRALYPMNLVVSSAHLSYLFAYHLSPDFALPFSVLSARKTFRSGTHSTLACQPV